MFKPNYFKQGCIICTTLTGDGKKNKQMCDNCGGELVPIRFLASSSKEQNNKKIFEWKWEER